MFKIYVDNELKKEYDYKLQAMIWAVMHGYVYSSRLGFMFSSRIRIEEK